MMALAGGTGLAAAQAAAADPDAERKADLVTAYRILVNEGILDSFGHVSVRSAKDPAIFLMPRAMPPALVSPDDILELRVSDSQPLEAKGRRVNGERYIHGEIYKARPDVVSVIHSHSQAVIPLSLTSIRLRPVVAQAGFLPPETPTFEIRDARKDGERGMQVTDSARGAALARTLASYPAALMRDPRQRRGRIVDQAGGGLCRLCRHQCPHADAGAAALARHRRDERARAVQAGGVRHQPPVGAPAAEDAGRCRQSQGRSRAVRARSDAGEAVARLRRPGRSVAPAAPRQSAFC
jgi:hypothetical protein